jgi:hypothetical protein
MLPFYSVFRIRIGLRSGFHDLNLRKFVAKKIYGFLIKNCNLLIPGPLKGRSSHRRSLQPSKENIQQSKLEIFFPFSYFFVVVIFVLLDPDPAEQNQCGSGYGSETLILSYRISFLKKETLSGVSVSS